MSNIIITEDITNIINEQKDLLNAINRGNIDLFETLIINLPENIQNVIYYHYGARLFCSCYYFNRRILSHLKFLLKTEKFAVLSVSTKNQYLNGLVAYNYGDIISLLNSMIKYGAEPLMKDGSEDVFQNMIICSSAITLITIRYWLDNKLYNVQGNLATELKVACIRGRLKAYRLLIEYGADPHHIYIEKKTDDGYSEDENSEDENSAAENSAVENSTDENTVVGNSDDENSAAGSSVDGNNVVGNSDDKIIVVGNTAVENNTVGNIVVGSNADTCNLAHYACLGGSLCMVKYLYNSGVDIHFVSVKGCSILHMCVDYDRKKIALFAIECGVDTNIQNEDNETALHLAARENKIHIMNLLLQNKADPNIQNIEGDTPMHKAVKYRNIKVQYNNIEGLQLLLSNGANPHIKNNDGKTPLMIIQEACLINDNEYFLRSKKPLIKLLTDYPRIASLRTLCLRVVKSSRMDVSDWPPLMFLWPDEIEENKERVY